MTICIAGICQHKGKKSVVLCGDFQGTRGDYLKAEDTYKFWHFHTGKGATAFAGDADAGKEFVRRFTAVTREFELIEKTKGDGDMDIRVGQYLAKIRALVREVIKERADHNISTRFSVSLQEFYAPDAPARFSPQRYEEIFSVIKATDLGAEFLVAYTGDDEPALIRIEQAGHVYIEDSKYVAIGSGEPLAIAVLSQIDSDEEQTLPECLTWIYQAKVAAERNPYVGQMTAFWILIPGQDDLMIGEKAWEIMENSTPRSTLLPVNDELKKLPDNKLLSVYAGPRDRT